MRLLATDTDSLIVWCQTDDLFQDMLQHAHLFDTSDFPKDHFLQSDVNKKVIGKMKSETNEKCISAFCGLRSKMYSFKCENTESKRTKGIKLSAQKHLRLEDYKNVLFNTSQMYSQMHALRSYNHPIFLENINKVGLSSFCSKRYLREDGIKSYIYKLCVVLKIKTNILLTHLDGIENLVGAIKLDHLQSNNYKV